MSEMCEPDTRMSKKRPKVELDEELILKFLSVGMPINKIAAYFNTTAPTIYTRFGNEIHQFRALYEYDIRAKQKELADAGDSKMLQFLGKVELGQKEQMPPQLAALQGVKFTIEAPNLVQNLTEDEAEELNELDRD